MIHNGLTLDDAPFERRRDDALVFVGHVTPEKGILDAIEAAQLAGRPLRIIAKVGNQAAELVYDRCAFQPAIERAGSSVEFMGEPSGEMRANVVASSYATLMPSAWPEPFGLGGTARERLDRPGDLTARRGPARFSADRMTDAYEALMLSAATSRATQERPRLRVTSSSRSAAP